MSTIGPNHSEINQERPPAPFQTAMDEAEPSSYEYIDPTEDGEADGRTGPKCRTLRYLQFVHIYVINISGGNKYTFYAD